MTQCHTTGHVMNLILTGVLHIAGCASVGPHSVFRDRFDDIGEVARSCKAQALRNILFFINRALGLVMVFLTLADTGARERPPLVTIPAG